MQTINTRHVMTGIIKTYIDDLHLCMFQTLQNIHFHNETITKYNSSITVNS